MNLSKSNASVHDCRVIDLLTNACDEGNLTAVYGRHHVPFEIRRVYYLYDVPGGTCRGGHAHHELQQVLIAAMGAFTVVLDDGTTRKSVRLERANQGLLIPQLIWRELIEFSSGGVCLVLASHCYDEAEYIRNYECFVAMRNKCGK